jgi:DNA-binding NtrC family response regulator
MERGRVLFVDDEETFLRATCELLRREGYTCDGVPEAATALQMLREKEYDLLIAGIRMLDQAELAFIQEIPKTAEGMPVILATGYPSTYTAIKSLQLPVMAYLPKPLDFGELLSHVQKGVEHYRAYKNAAAETCQLFNCPRFNTLNAAIIETIAVLEKTKNTFTSKELDELRQKLEKIVVPR